MIDSDYAFKIALETGSAYESMVHATAVTDSDWHSDDGTCLAAADMYLLKRGKRLLLLLIQL